MGVADEIGRAMARIHDEQAADDARAERQRAMAIVATIPSGTKDADLTSEQAAALDRYERANAILAALRDTTL